MNDAQNEESAFSATPKTERLLRAGPEEPGTTAETNASTGLDETGSAVARSAAHQRAATSNRITIFSTISVGDEQKSDIVGYLEGEWTNPESFKVKQLMLFGQYSLTTVIKIGERLGVGRDIQQALAAQRTNADSWTVNVVCQFEHDPVPVVRPPVARDEQTFDVRLIPQVGLIPSQKTVSIDNAGGSGLLRVALRY
jgi:hypothetical protein